MIRLWKMKALWIMTYPVFLCKSLKAPMIYKRASTPLVHMATNVAGYAPVLLGAVTIQKNFQKVPPLSKNKATWKRGIEQLPFQILCHVLQMRKLANIRDTVATDLQGKEQWVVAHLELKMKEEDLIKGHTLIWWKTFREKKIPGLVLWRGGVLLLGNRMEEQIKHNTTLMGKFLWKPSHVQACWRCVVCVWYV